MKCRMKYNTCRVVIVGPSLEVIVDAMIVWDETSEPPPVGSLNIEEGRNVIKNCIRKKIYFLKNDRIWTHNTWNIYL